MVCVIKVCSKDFEIEAAIQQSKMNYLGSETDITGVALVGKSKNRKFQTRCIAHSDPWQAFHKVYEDSH